MNSSLAANGKFGGHFVQGPDALFCFFVLTLISGHVDGTGTIISFKHEKDSLWVTVRASPELIKFIVEKGASPLICSDMVMLTLCCTV